MPSVIRILSRPLRSFLFTKSLCGPARNRFVHRTITTPSGGQVLLKCKSFKRSPPVRTINIFTVGLEGGLLAVAAYHLTRLKRPDYKTEYAIFGSLTKSEAEQYPRRPLQCIADGSAYAKAPENSLQALSQCIKQGCHFIHTDLRSTRDGRLVLLRDRSLGRLLPHHSTMQNMDIDKLNWSDINYLDISKDDLTSESFEPVHLCLLDQALDLIQEKKARLLIDIQSPSHELVHQLTETILDKDLYSNVVITCYNPLVLYQIRKKHPKIVTAATYFPYILSYQEYDSKGPHTPRTEVQYWRNHGIRCIGTKVTDPLDKIYWKEVFNTPYIASTLVGESEIKEDVEEETEELTKQKTSSEILESKSCDSSSTISPTV